MKNAPFPPQHPLSFSRTKTQLLFITHLSSLYDRLSCNIAREVCSYIGSFSYLPAISGHQLVLFDVSSRAKVEINMRQSFLRGAVLCVFDEALMMVVGGKRGTFRSVFTKRKLVIGEKSVTHVNLLTYEVKPVPHMHSDRIWPGVIHYKEFIYVFGSYSAYSSHSAEKLSISTHKWTTLRDMGSARSRFNPCLWSQTLYLPATAPRGIQVEAFNPTTEQYRFLPLRLFSKQNVAALGIIDGEMILMGSRDIDVWEGEEESKEIWGVSGELVTGSRGMMNVTPVRIGGFVYCACAVEGLLKYDLQSRRFV